MHTVSIGHDGLSPKLRTRITNVDRKKGEATMEIKIDDYTSTKVSLRRSENTCFSDQEWNKFVKVDGNARLRSVQMYPTVVSYRKVDLTITQVQMNHNMFVDVR